MKMRTCYPLAFAALVAFSGCDSSPGSKALPAESKGTVAAEKKSYTLTDREQTLLNNLFIHEIIVVAEDGDGSPELIKQVIGGYVVTTSDKLQKAYEKNEVAGDQAFRNKTILANGIVKSIDRSIGENYFISLKGGSNPFMQPKASMADGYTDFLASLEKGNRVFLSCKGDGMLMGSAMLSKCEPLINFASKVTTGFLSKVNIAAKPDASNATTLMLSVLSVAAAASLPESSSCFSTKSYEAKCVAEMNRFFNSKDKTKQEEYKNAIQSASKKIGVDVDALKASLAAPG